jgi:MFS family permease
MDGLSLELDQAGSLVKNGPFRRLWVAQFCATAAVYGLSLAAVVRVEDQAQSSAWTAAVVLSAILPAFLGSLLAGPVVDRLGRVRVLQASHLGRALVALAFWGTATLLPSDLTLPAIFAANAALALLTQFAMPAELALLPDLVGQQRLISANSLLQLTWLVAEGLSIIILSPLVIKLAGVPAVGLLGAFLCFLALVLVMAMPRDQASDVRVKGGRIDWAALEADLRAGWRAITDDRLLLLVAIQATLAATMLLILVALVPGLASRHLGLGAEDTPFLVLPGGVGFVLGSILVNRWEARLSRQGWIAMGLVGLGLGLGLLAALSGSAVALIPVLVVVLGMGLALALVIIPSRTVLQERPPAALRGRVIAAQLALANAAAVAPVLMGGALADRLGIQPVLGLLALVSVVAGAVGWRYART